jgi:hypothetical protein
MIMTTMVDTSVWVDFFDGRATPGVSRLKGLARHEELIVGDIILAEVLQGIRTEEQVRRVEAAWADFRVVSLVGAANARRSARQYRELRRRGITIRNTIDCLIATWCIRHGVALLHADRDFAPFAAFGLVEA